METLVLHVLTICFVLFCIFALLSQIIPATICALISVLVKFVYEEVLT